MAKIILSEEEKSAILRSVEFISNIYHERLPDNSEISRELKSYLKLSQTPCKLLSIDDTTDILKRFYKKAEENRDFVSDIFEWLISKSDFGVCKKAKKINEKYYKDSELLDKETNVKIKKQKKNNLFEEKDAKIARLISPFEEEWDLVFDYFGENIIDTELFLMLLDDIPRFLHSSYTLIDEQPTEQQTSHNHNQNSICKAKDISNVVDFNFSSETLRRELKDELRQEFIAEMRRELKEKLRQELKEEISKEIKELVSKEVNETLHKHLKDFATNNFNETLYKDL